MGAAVRLVTWNVQGLHGVDVAVARDLLVPLTPDAVALQEVQPRQCRALAEALGMRARWAFKHWPIPHHREGLALLTRDGVTDAEVVVLRRALPWDWRRRVALAATVPLGASDGGLAVVVVHLSPHDQTAARRHEIERVLARVGDRQALILGDFNDHPDGPTSVALSAQGWRDAWVERHGDADGPTNWTAGGRAGRRPTQRLDYVFVPPGWRIDAARVLDDPFDALAAMSDHLPLFVELSRPGSAWEGAS